METPTSRDSPYFRIERKPAKRAGSLWRAVARIIRNDTDELIDEVYAKDTSYQAAEERLTLVLSRMLDTLQRPDDWGRDATVAHLVQQYLRMNDQLYGKVLRAGGAVQPEAARLRREAEAYERAELTTLTERVAALTEPQRLELAGLTNEQRAGKGNARILDILTAKKRLSELIPNRSPAVDAAYHDLVQALNE